MKYLLGILLIAGLISAPGMLACGNSDGDGDSAQSAETEEAAQHNGDEAPPEEEPADGDETGTAGDATGPVDESAPPADEPAGAPSEAPQEEASPRVRQRVPAGPAGRAVLAVRTAAGRIGNGRPFDIESEGFRGRRVWEVEVASRGARPFLVIVNSAGNRVLRVRHKRDRDDDVAKVRQARVSLARAIQIADRHAPGRFDEGEIDRDDGRLVWELSFDAPDVEVTLDARSGRVLEVD